MDRMVEMTTRGGDRSDTTEAGRVTKGKEEVAIDNSFAVLVH
jgi:hypothetical protein